MDNNEVKKAWSSVGDELSGLGLKLKLHVQEEFSEDDNAEVSDALKRLGNAIDDAVGAVGNVAKDEAVRDDVRQTGQLLVNALATTFDQAISGFRSSDPAGSTEPSESSEASDSSEEKD